MAEMDRRTFVGALALAKAAVATAQPALKGEGQRKKVTASVMDFGAAGDGITDDTDAFNRATRATESWSQDLEYNILVPAGRYRIAGTVYVRKGQSLRGDGVGSYIDASGAKGPTFVLGRGKPGSVPADDPGGAPVEISQLRTLGGSDRHGLVYTNAAGFLVSDLFISAPGIGIQIEGADGMLSNIIIDQGLNGITFRNAQNITAMNIQLFSLNFGLTFGSECNEIMIRNMLASYTKCTAILFADGENINNIIFDSSVFVKNVQYDSFIGFVHIRASHMDAQFSNCSFRNWKDHAIRHAAGANVILRFSTCVFDGSRSNKTYWHSTTARGIETGPQGSYTFSSCEFRHLAGEIALVNSDLTSLRFENGSVTDAPGERILVRSTQKAPIQIRKMAGFPLVTVTDSHFVIALPWWGEVTAWRVTFSADVPQRGSVSREMEEGVVTVSRAARRGEAVSIDHTLLWRSAGAAAQPIATVDIGAVAGRHAADSGRSGMFRLMVPRDRVRAETLECAAETLP